MSEKTRPAYLCGNKYECGLEVDCECGTTIDAVDYIALCPKCGRRYGIEIVAYERAAPPPRKRKRKNAFLTNSIPNPASPLSKP